MNRYITKTMILAVYFLYIDISFSEEATMKIFNTNQQYTNCMKKAPIVGSIKHCQTQILPCQTKWVSQTLVYNAYHNKCITTHGGEEYIYFYSESKLKKKPTIFITKSGKLILRKILTFSE